MKQLLKKAAKELYKYSSYPLRLIYGYTVELPNGKLKRYPKPSDKDLILKSAEISNSSDYQQAINFLNKYNQGKHSNSLNILKANRDLNHEEKWLSHMNSYLSFTNAQPISLESDSQPKFFRLKCVPGNSNNSGPLVSIIMTSYNSGKTIEYAVTSILSQTWSNIELIIVDDMSKDDTWEIVTKLMATNKKIKCFRNKKNIGTYASKNIGFLYAEGDYITTHDSDDWSHPQRIERQVINMINDEAKASMLLKIRVLETMEVTRFKSINNSCIDGISHYSLPSLMFESNFFRQNIGAWDCVRFSADKEILKRTEIALDGNIKKYTIFGQICLELDKSLTNNPIFGIKHSIKKDSPRKIYKRAYKEWHKSLSSQNTFMNFPQRPRLFKAPDIALVNLDDIEEVLKHH